MGDHIITEESLNRRLFFCKNTASNLHKFIDNLDGTFIDARDSKMFVTSPLF